MACLRLSPQRAEHWPLHARALRERSFLRFDMLRDATDAFVRDILCGARQGS